MRRWKEGKKKVEEEKPSFSWCESKRERKSIHLQVERKRERRLVPRADHYCVWERKKLHYGDIDTSLYNGSPLSCGSYSYVRIQRAIHNVGIRFSLWLRYSLRWRVVSLCWCSFAHSLYFIPFPGAIINRHSTFDISIHIAAASSQQFGCYILDFIKSISQTCMEESDYINMRA